MLEADEIRDWRGHDVIGPGGEKIGKLEAVYVDTATDRPTFASVEVGMIGRRRLTFVPLDRASVGPTYLRVAYAGKLVKDALQIDIDGELPAGDEPPLFEHYGLDYRPGAAGERRLARR